MASSGAFTFERQELLAATAVQLAVECFSENLRLAFVGGSYGVGRARTDSDVDVFVVLWQPAANDELAFASTLRDLHRAHELSFEHCGEVFDVETLSHLLTVTEHWLRAVPELQDVGCYHGDCILSAFRKGDIVMKFLLDPKRGTVGDVAYLAALERRAVRYFEAFPTERVQLAKGRLTFARADRYADLERSCRERATTAEYVDTPIGVSLHRWFGARVLPQQAFLPSRSRAHVDPAMRGRCPLSHWGERGAIGAVVREQCLAHTSALSAPESRAALDVHRGGHRGE